MVSIFRTSSAVGDPAPKTSPPHIKKRGLQAFVWVIESLFAESTWLLRPHDCVIGQS